MMNLTVTGGGLGLDFISDIRKCYARGGAVSKGDLVALCVATADDKITGDSLTPTLNVGAKESIFASVTKAYADATVNAGIFAVALEDVADEALGKFQFRGLIEAAKGIRSDNAGTTNAVIVGQAGVASRASTATPGSASNAGMIEWMYQGVSPSVATSVTMKVIALSRTAFANATGASVSTAANYQVLFDGINGFGGMNT